MFTKLRLIFFEFERKFFPTTRPMFNEVKGKDLVGVEVGVNKGLNAYRLLKAMDIKMLYLIDPYPIEFTDSHLTYDNGDERYEYAQNLLKEFNNKKFYRCTVNNITLPMLDFAYIDGDHSYEGTMTDLKAIYPKVKKGGILGGDNFDVHWIGVPLAVIDFAREHNLEIKGTGNQWWFNV